MATLHLFRGHPGAGKSEAAHRMFPSIVKFENDQYFMHNGKYEWNKDQMPAAIAWCMEMVESALDCDIDVCVCNTFTKKRYIAAYEKLAKDAGAKFEVYRCNGNFNNVHGLPPSMVESFKKSMEDWPGEILVEAKAY